MDCSSHLLVVDDDREIRDLLSRFLAKHGFRVTTSKDGREARRILANARIDLVILDVMMPGEDGLTVCRELRAKSRTPIIMLTAMGEDTDRIVGLEMGADDYLAKPFNPRELVARIKAIFRRTGEEEIDEQSELDVGPLRAVLKRREAFLNGEPLKLTNAEFVVLFTLMRSAGEVVSREALTRAALGRALLPDDRSLDTHISNLRKKLANDSGTDLQIRSVRGSGYVLVPPEAAT
jgi:two-component system OmpR family response regulator